MAGGKAKDGSGDGVQRQIIDLVRASAKRGDEAAGTDEDELGLEADEDELGLVSKQVDRHQSVPKSQEPYVVYKDGDDKYGIGIMARFDTLDTSETPHYLAYPKDVVDARTAGRHLMRNFDDEPFTKLDRRMSNKDNRERMKHCGEAWREAFEPHGALMNFVKDGDRDAPVYTMYDATNGLPLALQGASGASPDSALQLGFYKGELARHMPSSVHPRSQASNWAIGYKFTAHDEIVSAALHRALWDTATPWAQREGLVQWLLNAHANLAAARQADPCYHGGGLNDRVQHYGKQDLGELRASALFWAHPTGANKYMKNLIKKRRGRGRVTLDFGSMFNKYLRRTRAADKEEPAKAERRKEEYAVLEEAFWQLASEHPSRPSKEEMERYFFHHRVLFPFHDSERKYLPEEGDWTIDHLFAMTREEVEHGLKSCNAAAVGLGLDEPDLYVEENWARIVLPIFAKLLDRLAVAKEAASSGRDELARAHQQERTHDDHDPGFMDEVACMLTDKGGNPIMATAHSFGRFVHDSLSDPRFAMTSGYGWGPNGERLEAKGPLRHDSGDKFNLVRSLDMRARQMSLSSNATNMGQGKQHPSLFPANRARLLCVVTHGPLNRLDDSLGEHPWMAPGPQDHHGTAPKYPFSIPLPPVPDGEIVDQPLDGQGRPRPLLQSCTSPDCRRSGAGQDVAPGTLLHHYIVHHCSDDSDLAHPCPDCHMRFYLEELLTAHREMSCVMAEGHLEAAHKFWQDYGHHVGGQRGDKCRHGPGGDRYYFRHALEGHLRTCGIPIDQREYHYACACFVYWSNRKLDVENHQAGADHEKQMEVLSDPDKTKYAECEDCGLRLGDDEKLRQLHDKWCVVIRRYKDSPDKTATTIIPDGAPAAKRQADELKLFQKLCKGEAGGLCGSIKQAGPSDTLPEDGHCGTCLQKLPQRSDHKEVHKRRGTHKTAEKLLKFFGSLRTGEAAAIRLLRTAFHGHDPQAVSDFLATFFLVEIPDDEEDFCKKVEECLDIIPLRKGKSWKESILSRLIRLDKKYTPGPLDCVDCCVPKLTRDLQPFKSSPHWASENHLRAVGFVDSMLASLGVDDTKDVRNRARAVREIQRRYNAHRNVNSAAKRGPQDNGSTGALPPVTKRQRRR